MRRTASILIASAASIGLAWSGGDPAPPTAAAGPPGQATYQRLCKSCHAEDGRGAAAKAKVLKLEPQMLDLARPEAAKLTRDERREALLAGKNKMPAYGAKLKPEEIDPLLEYVDALVAAAPKGQ